MHIMLGKVANAIGYEGLMVKQEEAIVEFMSGKDVFVSLPTGSGKSLCYSILPLAFDAIHLGVKQSIAVIVSALISLMEDQIRAMANRNVTAVHVGDSAKLNEDEIRKVCEREYQLVFMSSESLLTDSTWRDMLQTAVYQERLIAFVVDEAHCVKKWYDTNKIVTPCTIIRT